MVRVFICCRHSFPLAAICSSSSTVVARLLTASAAVVIQRVDWDEPYTGRVFPGIVWIPWPTLPCWSPFDPESMGLLGSRHLGPSRLLLMCSSWFLVGKGNQPCHSPPSHSTPDGDHWRIALTRDRSKIPNFRATGGGTRKYSRLHGHVGKLGS